MKKHIPNFITCLNLLSGGAAAIAAYEGDFRLALALVLLAAVFDFFDGFAARLLKAYSPIGKELDSLADCISFGFAPAMVAFSLLRASALPDMAAYLGLIISAFSALRLAKFNVDERQTSSFIGLATPANAIFWTGLAYSANAWLSDNPYLVLALIVVFSLLLVCELPMFSLKFKSYGWRGNEWRWLLLGGAVLLVALLRLDAFAPIIVWYIALATVETVLSRKK